MNSLSPKTDDAEVAAIMVGILAVFFSLAIMLIVYLSDYSLGSDFADTTLNFSGPTMAVEEGQYPQL